MLRLKFLFIKIQFVTYKNYFFYLLLNVLHPSALSIYFIYLLYLSSLSILFINLLYQSSLSIYLIYLLNQST